MSILNCAYKETQGRSVVITNTTARFMFKAHAPLELPVHVC